MSLNDPIAQDEQEIHALMLSSRLYSRAAAVFYTSWPFLVYDQAWTVIFRSIYKKCDAAHFLSRLKISGCSIWHAIATSDSHCRRNNIRAVNNESVGNRMMGRWFTVECTSVNRWLLSSCFISYFIFKQESFGQTFRLISIKKREEMVFS